MDGVEAVLTYGVSGWPTWVHHATRELHWRVIEVVEPRTATYRPPATDRYVLIVDGPFAFLTGEEGEHYITATRRDGRWQIDPNTTTYPQR